MLDELSDYIYNAYLWMESVDINAMNIGFDAKRLFNNNTGLGNYSRTLVRNLQKRYPHHNYHLYTDRIRRNTETAYFFDKDRFIIHEGPKYFKALWRSKFLVNDLEHDKIDIYHGLSNELPYGIHKSSVKSVVTIHDLIFKAYPRQYRLLDRKIYHLKSGYAISNSDATVAISMATKNDIIKYYNTSEDKISIVYQSCSQDLISSEALKLDLKPPYTLPSSYFLYVGSIIERKGLLNIAKALNSLPKEDRIPIVVVGNGSRYLNTVKAYLNKQELTDMFYFLKGISNTDLGYLYKHAESLIYPSLIEGFGIPIIEAGLLLTPIISSNRSSLPEAGGPDIIQVNPEDHNEIAQAMCSIAGGLYPKVRSQKVKAYMEAKFDEVKLSNEIMSLYLSL